MSPDTNTPPKIRIQTAADLFEVLTEGTLEARVGVLRSIVQDPRRPLSLGKHQGEDIVDLLLRLFRRSPDGLQQMLLMCLSCFQDPRTTEFMQQEFARSRDAGSVLHLGRRLSMDKESDFFRDFLWKDKPAQGLAAARNLAHHPQLTPKERLRVAILLDVPYEPPSIEQETLDLWIAELTGYHRSQVRSLAELREKEVLLFWERWTELGPVERDWLIDLTARLDPSLARQRLISLLGQRDTSAFLVQKSLEPEFDTRRHGKGR